MRSCYYNLCLEPCKHDGYVYLFNIHSPSLCYNYRLIKMTLQASEITLRIDFQSSFLQNSHTSVVCLS